MFDVIHVYTRLGVLETYARDAGHYMLSTGHSKSQFQVKHHFEWLGVSADRSMYVGMVDEERDKVIHMYNTLNNN